MLSVDFHNEDSQLLRKESTMKFKVLESLKAVQDWVEKHDYKGYEPFDGLGSYLRPCTFGNTFLERLLQQLVRQCPLNLRPLLGVKRLDSTKGRGYMAWGYLHMYQATGYEEYRDKALLCLEWLDRNKSPLYQEHSWGNHFDYASRGGGMPRHQSTIVWTSLIGQAYLQAYELFRMDRHLEILKSISRWILSLPREQTPQGICLSYVAPLQSSIHNSNMLGAAFLAMSSKYTGHVEASQIARDAMAYSCSGQLPEGGWYYGEAEKYHWIDNFHTGYKLDSLKRYIEATGDTAFQENLDKGFRFFKNAFFEQDGCPRYYHNRKYPIDIQCASQAIETLVFFSDRDPDALTQAERVADWTIANMQDQDGHFYYRIYPFRITAKAPMLHWGQATMFRAISLLYKTLNTL